MQKLLIIHNIDYHFEVLISLYQIIKDIGYDPWIYVCKNVSDTYKQSDFMRLYGLNTVNDYSTDSDFVCAIVVTAYPYPESVVENNIIPNNDDIIFSQIKNNTTVLYITHCFKYQENYNLNNTINIKNTLSLSPISKKLGIEHIYLDRNPIKPTHNYDSESIKITIQGHFGYNHRDTDVLINNILNLQFTNNKKIVLNIIGTTTNHIVKKLKNIKLNEYNITLNNIQNVDEETFYFYINKETDWIFALVSPLMKHKRYSIESFSSTFCHALTLEKPIISDEFFQNIYEIPGVYYSNENKFEVLNKIINYDNYQYDLLVEKFRLLKTHTLEHNRKTIQKRILLNAR